MLKGYFHSKTIPRISQGRLYWFYMGERLARCCCPVGCRESPGNERAIQQEKSNTKERVVRYAAGPLKEVVFYVKGLILKGQSITDITFDSAAEKSREDTGKGVMPAGEN